MDTDDITHCREAFSRKRRVRAAAKAPTPRPRKPRISPYGRVNEKIMAPSEPEPISCPICLTIFSPRRPGTRFCKPACRLLAWGLRTLAKALLEGRAQGLKPAEKEIIRASIILKEIIKRSEDVPIDSAVPGSKT